MVLAIGLGRLAVAFFQTQVLKNDAYALQSDANRLRPLPVPAPRGTIFDRNGKVVADNVPGYALSLLPAPADTIRRMLERLSDVLGLTPERIDALLERRRKNPHQPLLVSGDLTFEQVSAIEERRWMFPGIFIDVRPKRRYVGGPAVAHLVGYVAEISEAELELPEFEGYTAGQQIGKQGLERQYERILAGKPGVRYVEVDALGRIVGEFAPRTAVPPEAGGDIHLYIDLDLQRWIAEIFPDSMRGAVVAVEPGTGHVLALYSNPAYDPNAFVGGVSPSLWAQLNTDAGRPLLHRATSGVYPPGSAFKIVTAAIALEQGVIDPKAVMPTPCRGGFQYGNRFFRCWDAAGHGYLDLPGAIAKSCNVYFYQVGLRIGLNRLLEEATRLGFSRRASIDLPDEARGTFPEGPEYFRTRFGWDPTPAEVLSLSIGQGPNAQTPLKLAHFFAAIARDGRIPPPRIAAVGPPAKPSDPGGLELDISAATLEMLREGLRRVVAPGGTAHMSSLEHWELMGKTSTSQNPHGPPHAWFVGLAGPRGGEPEIAIAAVVEFGESGARAAAPIVAKAADYYLRRKYGMPVDTIQTLREHLLAGRPAPWAR